MLAVVMVARVVVRVAVMAAKDVVWYRIEVLQGLKKLK